MASTTTTLEPYHLITEESREQTGRKVGKQRNLAQHPNCKERDLPTIFLLFQRKLNTRVTFSYCYEYQKFATTYLFILLLFIALLGETIRDREQESPDENIIHKLSHEK